MAYPILGRGTTLSISLSKTESIYPLSPVLHSLTSLVTTVFGFSWTVVAMYAAVISFNLCLVFPKLLMYFHYFFDPRIHLWFMPHIAACFRFSIHVLMDFNNQSTVKNAFCVLFVAILVPYLIIISVLNLSSSNSFYNPSFGHAQWFSSLSLFFPIYLFFYSFVGFACFYTSVYVEIFNLLVFVVISFSFGYFCISQLPLMHFIGNEVFATRFFLSSFLGIVAIMSVSGYALYPNFVFSLIPFFSAFIYYIVYRIIRKKRLMIRRILEDIEDTSNNELDIDSLSSVLQSYASPENLKLLYKEVINSSHRLINSHNLLKIAISNYPEEKWFFALAPFLYSLFLEANNDVYRIFLHLLSSCRLGFHIEYSIFQFVYYWAMSSKFASPIIQREVNQYRLLTLKYVYEQKLFWKSAVDNDIECYESHKFQMYHSFSNMKRSLKRLLILFPNSPLVLYEASLFYHDFANKFEKSHNFFQKAEMLVNSHKGSFVYGLNHHYQLFFPTFLDRSNIKKDKALSYSVISFFDSSKQLNRRGMTIGIIDQYLSTLTHPYTIPMSVNQIEPSFDRRNTLVFYSVFTAIIISYISLFGIHFYIFKSQEVEYNAYLNIIDSMNDTLAFYKVFHITKYCAYSYFHVNNHTYDWIPHNSTVLHYLSNFSSTLLPYYYKFNSRINSILSTNYSISLALENCSSKSCSFPFLFGIIHNHLIQMSESSVFLENPSNIDIFEFNWIYNDMDGLIRVVFSDLIRILRSTSSLNSDYIYISFILIMASEISITIFGGILMYQLLSNLSFNIYTILRTCQPPILKEMLTKYDKIITYFKINPESMEIKYSPSIVFPIIIMFGFLILYPLSIVLHLWYYRNNEITYPSLPMKNIVSSQSLKLFLLSLLIENNISNTNLIEIGSTISDFSHFFSVLPSNYSLNISSGDFFSLVFLRYNQVLNFISLWISCFGFFLFLYHLKINLQMINLGKSLIKQIPLRAVQSSPVMKKLHQKDGLLPDEVMKFSEDVFITPTDFLDFGFISLDESDQVIYSSEAVESLLGVTPSKLTTIREQVLFISNEFVNEIEDFFNKTSRFLLVSNSQDRALVLQFDGSYMNITIMNENNQMEKVLIYLKEKRIIKAFDFLHRIKMENSFTGNAIILMFFAPDTEVLREVTKMVYDIGDTQFLDGRNRRIVFAMQESVYSADKALFCIKMIKNTAIQATSLLHVGILRSNPILKGKESQDRCRPMFDDYADALIALKTQTLGSPIITEQFLEIVKERVSVSFLMERKLKFFTPNI